MKTTIFILGLVLLFMDPIGRGDDWTVTSPGLQAVVGGSGPQSAITTSQPEAAAGSNARVVSGDPQPPGSLGRLQHDESLVIYFSSYGCFSHSGKKLVFIRGGDGVHLKVYDGQVIYGKDGEQPSLEQGKLLKEKLMTDADLIIFSSFEKELSKRRDGGCTTSEMYTMVSNYGSLSVSDASCRWFGMNQLMTDLFGKDFFSGGKVIEG